MQEKLELFDKLPLEIKFEIAQYLPSSDLSKLACSSKYYWNLFKPILNVNKFLHFLVRHHNGVVKEMLKRDINLIFKRGNVKDWSGRVFYNISGFEYFLWALDQIGWSVLLSYLPQDENRKSLLEKLLSQYNKINQEGVTYKFNGEVITEHHFNFQIMIKELEAQFNLHTSKKWKESDEQWIKDVGGAQRKLPIHMFYELSSEYYDIYNKPSFISNPKFVSRDELAACFFDPITEEDGNWFDESSKLGICNAIADKEWWESDTFRSPGHTHRQTVVNWDLSIIETLRLTRPKAFAKLKSELEEQIAGYQSKRRATAQECYGSGIV